MTDRKRTSYKGMTCEHLSIHLRELLNVNDKYQTECDFAYSGVTFTVIARNEAI